MNRLFTFGCSFTQYHRWPTWADIIGHENPGFENWALSGSGNSLIFNSLIECHQRNRITSNDEVMVMWTNTSREDRYVGRAWMTLGNIYWIDGNPLPLDYIKNFTCERGYLIRDLATITAARYFLDSLGCKWKFFSMVPLSRTNNVNQLGENPNDPTYLESNLDVVELYQDTLDCIQANVFESVFGSDWNRSTAIPAAGYPDMHPTPLEHLKFLDLVMPERVSDPILRQWAADQEKIVRDDPSHEYSPGIPASNGPRIRL